ncbi:MAG: serine--tRNA ligase [Alphaproteobacteria bacterium]|nr:serine--tRNA ligase [Alphaproteobacteria bacterium]
MHDVRAIRLDPMAFDQGMARRGLPPVSEAILALDHARREAQTVLQEAQARRKQVAALIGKAKGAGDAAAAESHLAEAEALKDVIAAQTAAESDLAARLNALLAGLPNLPGATTPDGAGEGDNVEVRRWGQPWDNGPRRDHADLGAALGLMDFETAARLAGSRFVVLKGPLARLERALGQFMLDMQTTEHGYTEVSPPLLVRGQALYGTGQLPKFEEDLFHTTDDRWLIPTAEVSLTNLVAGELLDEGVLPLRMTALTPCFRAEAGASGRDTKGMIRQHQFNKVEMVSIVAPERSDEELERMTACAEAILKRLELPFRTMALCTGDLGFSARKTYDLEVWVASQGAYREISSCSNCGDFQARRMEARCRAPGEKGGRFVHTLNGSGLAVGRALVAVMEHYQDEDGAIAIPQALHAYLPGLSRITPAA